MLQYKSLHAARHFFKTITAVHNSNLSFSHHQQNGNLYFRQIKYGVSWFLVIEHAIGSLEAESHKKDMKIAVKITEKKKNYKWEKLVFMILIQET